ncbi:hypothetical protein J2X98_002520 [Pseudarthrobacter enclensis]|uniref:Uncharacterized protein n=1 Tax=Pseudarthrobacter enclensis TaxID=993070 RepID=A0ABT9RVU5_9MICC|nr:hypothetical protein [Pseudarthrobacter enclensis]
MALGARQGQWDAGGDLPGIIDRRPPAGHARPPLTVRKFRMKALVYGGPGEKSWTEVPAPGSSSPVT